MHGLRCKWPRVRKRFPCVLRFPLPITELPVTHTLTYICLHNVDKPDSISKSPYPCLVTVSKVLYHLDIRDCKATANYGILALELTLSGALWNHIF